jgi:hypothetical protein
MKTLSTLLKVSAVLWGIWGFVHVLAGVLTMNGYLTDNISGAISGIADGVDASTLQMDYPDAAGAILAQHGFNLFWIGLVTLTCAFFIWKKNANAIFLAAIAGGLADLGYFIFLDLGGFVNFVPGSIMTIFSGTAIILSFVAYFKSDKMKAFQD